MITVWKSLKIFISPNVVGIAVRIKSCAFDLLKVDRYRFCPSMCVSVMKHQLLDVNYTLIA